jgi:hypothetical protein
LADDGHPVVTERALQHARELNPASSAALAQRRRLLVQPV